MRILVICRPRDGADPRRDIAPRAQEEMSALHRLRDEGILAEAYAPGGPGAVLIFDASRGAVERAVQGLPLVQAGVIEAELTELQPFPGFAAP